MDKEKYTLKGGQMDGRMNRLVDRWRDERIKGQITGKVEQWID